METENAEGDAALLLRLAGYDTLDAPSAYSVAYALGLTVHGVMPTEVWGNGEVDGNRILVRSGLPLDQEAFVVAHELAEWHCGRCHYRFGGIAEKENYCNSIAAALLAPWQAFRAAARAYGARFNLLSCEFGVSQTCAALRFGEVTGTPVALVTPKQIRVRGYEFGWPRSETGMRVLASIDNVKAGLHRTKLTDGNKRVALVANAA